MDLPHYPRTLHLGGSGGGTSRHRAPFSDVKGKHLVVEEKVDGTHCGLFFNDDAQLCVFSRKTIIEDLGRHHDFAPLAKMTEVHLDALWDVLGTRFILYGEWCHSTHSIFYDSLPSYFLEDDIYDRERERFIATRGRDELRAQLPAPFSQPVPVLAQGEFEEVTDVEKLVGKSRFKSSSWQGRCPDLSRVEDSDLMEGLYIKHESNEAVLARYKWVRRKFLEHIAAGKEHWRDRERITNALAATAS